MKVNGGTFDAYYEVIAIAANKMPISLGDDQLNFE